MTRNLKMLFAAVVVGVALMSSCTKKYRCVCSYDNSVRLDRYLGPRTKADAEAECNSYDTTVTGEKWTCTIR